MDPTFYLYRKYRNNISNYQYYITLGSFKEEGITTLVINGRPYSLSKIAESDALFSNFRNDKVESWIIDSGPVPEVGNYKYTFKELLSKSGQSSTFDDEIDSHELTIKKHTEIKRELEKKIQNIEGKSLCELMSIIGDGSNAESILRKSITSKAFQTNDSIIHILYTMIRNGYIAEDYSTYISYTYTGSFDDQDFKFQQSVLQRIPLEYNFSLHHIDSFIDTLSTDLYEDKSILNNDLLKYLLMKRNTTQLDAFIATARRNLDFVVQFDTSNGKDSSFETILFNKWNDCVKYISEQQDNDIRTYMLSMFFRNAPTTVQLSTEELAFISTQYKFISETVENCDIQRLEKFFNHYQIFFKELVGPTSLTKPLFDSVVSQNLFEINYTNLRCIYGESFDVKSYTSIISGNDSIKPYILNNIQTVLPLFPSSDIDESIESIACLSNENRISDETFEDFLARQNNLVPNFDNVNRKRLAIFFKTDKIQATWDNIKEYFTVEDDPDGIVPFIVRHATELAGSVINENDNKSLQLLLMTDNTTLPFEEFKLLLPCCEDLFDADEIRNLNEERLLEVLKKDFVQYSMETKQLYSSKSEKLWAEYLIHFFEQFKEDDAFGITIHNNTAIQILNSSLTLAQKKVFIDKLACPLEEAGLAEYCDLVCFYYQQMNIDEDTDVDILAKALNKNDGKVDWKRKIDLINRINEKVSYSKTLETRLLNALGGGYLSLNSFRGISYFDDNPENRTLLYYLQSKGHYVNKIKEEGGRLKVTFKNPPMGQ